MKSRDSAWARFGYGGTVPKKERGRMWRPALRDRSLWTTQPFPPRFSKPRRQSFSIFINSDPSTNSCATTKRKKNMRPTLGVETEILAQISLSTSWRSRFLGRRRSRFLGQDFSVKIFLHLRRRLSGDDRGTSRPTHSQLPSYQATHSQLAVTTRHQTVCCMVRRSISETTAPPNSCTTDTSSYPSKPQLHKKQKFYQTVGRNSKNGQTQNA